MTDNSNTNSKTGKIVAATLFLILINLAVFVMLTKVKKNKIALMDNDNCN